MNKIKLLFLMPLFAAPLLAKTHKPVAPCRTAFTVVRKDSLGNINQGLSNKQENWVRKLTRKKYAGVCYDPPWLRPALVFFITRTPAVYHGTRVVTSEDTHDSPVSGTVTDENGNTSDIDGTVTTTTSSSTAVPYSFPYGIYTLTIETRQANGKFKALRRFRQGGVYHAPYGIRQLGYGKGHHPTRTVIKEAMKWIDEGGLNNPLETVAPR